MLWSDRAGSGLFLRRRLRLRACVLVRPRLQFGTLANGRSEC